MFPEERLDRARLLEARMSHVHAEREGLAALSVRSSAFVALQRELHDHS